MMEINSAEEIMIQLSGMDQVNSEARIYVPGLGEFTIVLQKKEERMAEADERIMPAAGLKRNPYL
ncbi:hypothetical protein QW71_06470 [Paenibacillus sp. IHB B 3415]|uniref:hypothetical protein n=1 Tax=Paenibacillus sp. IHB B 3415 TaxID=867080 RepID=UPI000575AA39|nr:hypothetical protein [Paenibacillus sp. IHB B 3415]KHL96574.1 hypothetical protein QW71_06470 [Paenibacillus sp. IHB B 3415]